MDEFEGLYSLIRSQCLPMNPAEKRATLYAAIQGVLVFSKFIIGPSNPDLEQYIQLALDDVIVKSEFETTEELTESLDAVIDGLMTLARKVLLPKNCSKVLSKAAQSSSNPSNPGPSFGGLSPCPIDKPQPSPVENSFLRLQISDALSPSLPHPSKPVGQDGIVLVGGVGDGDGDGDKVQGPVLMPAGAGQAPMVSVNPTSQPGPGDILSRPVSSQPSLAAMLTTPVNFQSSAMPGLHSDDCPAFDQSLSIAAGHSIVNRSLTSAVSEPSVNQSVVSDITNVINSQAGVICSSGISINQHVVSGSSSVQSVVTVSSNVQPVFSGTSSVQPVFSGTSSVQPVFSGTNSVSVSLPNSNQSSISVSQSVAEQASSSQGLPAVQRPFQPIVNSSHNFPASVKALQREIQAAEFNLSQYKSVPLIHRPAASAGAPLLPGGPDGGLLVPAAVPMPTPSFNPATNGSTISSGANLSSADFSALQRKVLALEQERDKIKFQRAKDLKKFTELSQFLYRQVDKCAASSTSASVDEAKLDYAVYSDDLNPLIVDLVPDRIRASNSFALKQRNQLMNEFEYLFSILYSVDVDDTLLNAFQARVQALKSHCNFLHNFGSVLEQVIVLLDNKCDADKQPGLPAVPDFSTAQVATRAAEATFAAAAQASGVGQTGDPAAELRALLYGHTSAANSSSRQPLHLAVGGASGSRPQPVLFSPSPVPLDFSSNQAYERSLRYGLQKKRVRYNADNGNGAINGNNDAGNVNGNNSNA